MLVRDEPNENSVAKAEKSATFDPNKIKTEPEMDKQDSFDMNVHMEQARI